MEKSAAHRLVRETLENAFHEEQFGKLVVNLLNHAESAPFTYNGNYIYDDFQDSIRQVKRLGKYTDPRNRKIDILIVYLKKEAALDHARTKQRNFIAKYLNGSRGNVLKDAALVAFVAPNGEDWRFSLVRMAYRFDEQGKVKEELTPARRYSFLVGKNEDSHTAQSGLLPLLLNDSTDPTLDDLEDAFSVERVTREFFGKYRDLFLRLKESLDAVVAGDDKIQADFEAKNVDTGDFAKKLLGQVVFLYFLQKKGWFGVARGAEWGSGSKQFLRELFEKKHGDYENFFNDILEPLFYETLATERSQDWAKCFDCRIPFLNGGLFEPLNDYEWVDTDILLPNDLFSNRRKTEEGDTGDGILDIFDRYNFTVKEDEPLEKEVAVDPEMLGKVFENLLAVQDRKATGTYYTPREIVHYMCQESLTNYLTTELNGNVSKEDIEKLVQYGEAVVENDRRVVREGRETETYTYKLPPGIREQAKAIDDKLASIRVCDPAVGSGAFPVGMMNEIIRTRGALTPYIVEDGERAPYHFKRQAIQDCLYGVDIDPGAVEIAKLRLWLSLVVDEEEREAIQPLPNLDYKIVRGNALLSVKKNLFNHALFDKLEKLKSLQFNETSQSKKRNTKTQVDELFSKVTNGHKDFDFAVYFSEVFRKKQGFDVVIANPPYDVVSDRKFREIYAETIFGRANLYGLFIHKAVKDIVRPLGYLTFINPKTLLADKYFTKLRKFLRRNGNFKTMLKIADRHTVFENVLQAVIVYIFQRQEAPNQEDLILMHEIRARTDIESIENRLAVKADKAWLRERFASCVLVSDKKEVYHIFDKIHENTTPFFHAGISFTTGKIQWDLFKKQLTDKPLEGSARLIWAENIQRYRFSNSERRKGKEFIKGPLTIDTNITTKTIITQRTTADEQEYRIIATIFDPQIEGFNAFSENHTNYLRAFPNTFEMEFVLGLLNSSLFDLVFRHINSNTQVSSGELNSLPIKEFSLSDQRPITDLVKTLSLTQSADYLQTPAKQAQVHDHEKQIDQLVYQLYDLTDEEIAIVERASARSSRAETTETVP